MASSAVKQKTTVTKYRIAFRVLIETLKGIKQAGIVNIFIIGTMAAILAIFGGIFRTSISLGTLVNELGQVSEISVYLKSNADPKNSIADIKNMHNVERIRYIPKEASWATMKKQMRLPTIQNPLPDTLHVKVRNQSHIKEVANKLQEKKYVDEIRYAQKLADKMRVVSDISHTATVMILVIVGFLTMFIINNTIQLVIQSRKKEIELMRLMGVSNWFIRIPYILQGALYGVMGTIIAIIPLNILQGYIAGAHEFFGIPITTNAMSLVVLSLFLMSISFGALGSFLSIKNRLKV